MFRLDKNASLTIELLKKMVEAHLQTEVPRLEELENYFQGKTKILRRIMEDTSKPNNQISNPFANYITTNLVGYFMGKPVAYKSQDEQALEQLQMIFTYNDEQDENAELATAQSIYGVGYEMLYIDEEGSVRFRNVNPKEVIMVYDNTVENELLYAVRYYKELDLLKDEEYITIEVYSKTEKLTYKADVQLGAINLIDEQPLFFSLVPFVEYKNNEDKLGDFEEVMALIDAYDVAVSDTLNSQAYFADCYLALKGMTAEPEDIKAMKENRVMLLDGEDADAFWLTKDVNDTELENTKIRLERDIHKFAKCPNLSDENFAGNASGVAMAYKTMGTENLTAIKERKFKKGLQRRIELIAAINGLKSTSFDWKAIEIVFTRNIPVNIAETVDIASKLKGLVSDETILSILPFVEDVEVELERLKEQQEQSPFYNELPQQLNKLEEDNEPV